MNRLLASLLGFALVATPVLASAEAPAQPAPASKTVKTKKHVNTKAVKSATKPSGRHHRKLAHHRSHKAHVARPTASK